MLLGCSKGYMLVVARFLKGILACFVCSFIAEEGLLQTAASGVIADPTLIQPGLATHHVSANGTCETPARPAVSVLLQDMLCAVSICFLFWSSSG